MQSHTFDDAGHVDPKKTWSDIIVASFRPSDRHLTDDELYALINANADRADTAELLTAKGVTLPTYFVWKSKYRHLKLDELRERRRWELWRLRALAGALTIGALAIVGAGVFGLARVVQPAPASTADPSIASTRPTTAPDARDDAARPGEPAPVAAPTASAAIPDEGYKIQVAAPPTAGEARDLVTRLTSTGYAAYMSRAAVGTKEVFRVRVGPFDTLAAAGAVASRLHRDGYPDAWIAR